MTPRYSIIAASLLFSLLPLQGQNPDQGLQVDPGEDAFKRAENIYNAARGSEEEAAQQALYSRAIPQLKTYLKAFPNHKNTPAALYYLGYAQSKTGRRMNARKTFKQLISTYKKGPAVIQAARFMGYDTGFTQNYKEAARYFGIVAEQSKQPKELLEANLQQGICLQEIQDSAGAIKAFQTAIKLSELKNISYQKAQLRLAQIYLKQKKYAEALPHLNLISVEGVLSKIRSEATFFQGLCLYETKQLEAAKKSYSTVLSLTDPTWKAEAVVALMSVSYAEGDYREVIKAAATPGVKLDATQQGRKDILTGQSYLKLKKYREAVESFSSVEKRFPNSVEAFEASYRKILCFYNLKSKLVVNQVNTFIKKYRGKYPRHLFMHTAMMLQAETLFESKNYALAAKAYGQVDINLIAAGNRPNVLYKTAWCFYETKNYSSSVEWFSHLLKVYPNDPRKATILNVRARCYVALKKPEQALKDYDEIIKLYPKTQIAGQALQASARILKERNDFKQMVRRYESLIDTVEDLEPVVLLNAHYWAAWGHFKTKDYKGALPHIEKANEIDQGAYKKQLSLLAVLCNYQLKNKNECMAAAKQANTAGIANDIPMAIYRWLGIQCYKSGEFADAQAFLSLGVTKLRPGDTPVSYWRILAKCQYLNKHYKWALQSLTHALNLETDEAHKVNLELYKALCQQSLNQPELAKTTSIAALKKNPTGKTKAMLLRLLGDIYFKEQDYQQSAISFASINDFYEDQEILPYAIAMVIKSLEASNKPSDAELYRSKLKKEFPDYKIPE